MKKSDFLFIPTILVLTLGGCTSQPTDKFYVVANPKKTSFNVGESFTTSGLRLINYRDGTEITDYSSSIAEGYVFTIADVGEKSVVISKPSYQNYQYTITVTNFDDLVIEGNPTVEFIVGETFNTNGLIVTCGGEVITGYSVSFSSSYIFTETGEYSVTVSKEGYVSASYMITVFPKRALTITSFPKVEYTEGDLFDLTGLVVEDERGNTVTDYATSLSEGDVVKGEGAITIYVEKDGYQRDQFTINVTKSESHETVNKTIYFYYLNDTHGSYTRDGNLYETGMPYLSTYIKQKVESHSETAIVLSGGDMFQGGYESNETRGDIMIDSMNEIGFDAMVVGNHEFDWGEEYIYKFADGLNCDMISSNIFYSSNNARPSWVKPYTIINKDGVRIGIIGGAQYNLGTSITGSVSESFVFPEPNSYIKTYSTQLRNNYGCDLIIAAFHDGGTDGWHCDYCDRNFSDDEVTNYCCPNCGNQVRTADPTKFYDLTENDPSTGKKYVDGMFFAHDHQRKEYEYNGVPYLESGCNGKNIGVMTFDLTGNGISFEVDNYTYTNVSGYSNCKTYDSSFTQIEEKYAEIFTKGKEVIYTFSKPYSKDEFTEVACMAMLWYVNSHLSEFDNTSASMASHNNGGVRSTVPQGAMTYKDYVKIFPFDNYLSMQKCSQYNINRYNSQSYYITYGTPVMIDGYANVISINYITERYNASYYQVSYKNYEKTAKEVLYLYLKGNINPSL